MKNGNKTIKKPQAVDVFAGISGVAFIAMVTVLAGCGGGGSSSSLTPALTASAATGRALFTVVWPAPSTTRLVPVASASIRVEILRGNTVLATQLVARPDAGGSATLTFPNLPVETLTARATAYPTVDGTGTAQATGNVPIVIQAGQAVNFTLTMASTIDHLDVAAPSAVLAVGQQEDLTATARDAAGNAGNVVLTSPDKLQWSSSNSSVATVSASGIVTAIAPGGATITVTDQESGKSTSVTFTVSAVPTPTPTPVPTPTPTPDPFAAIRQFLTIDPNNPSNYANPTFPVHYDAGVLARDNTPGDNPTTNRGATLGRVLFFDRRLSINDTVSCASCHQPPNGMTDSRRFSAGFSGADFTSAHSMRLGNIRFYAGRSMFWDKRAATVEAQATQPIQNSVEMGFDAAHGGFAAVISKMETLPYYPELFRWVYGDPSITEDRVQRALAQFERSMVSVNSRFDTEFARVYDPADPQRGVGRPFPGYTAQEARGKDLFVRPPAQGGAGCVGCHQAPTFALDPNSRSNGLDAGENRIFKSPSLKNVALTGPYMHDGRFQTLEQVVDHYISGVQGGPALDNRLRTPGGQPLRLPLTQADRDALVAFMRTLNDNVLTSDPKFSNPFRP